MHEVALEMCVRARTRTLVLIAPCLINVQATQAVERGELICVSVIKGHPRRTFCVLNCRYNFR